MTANNLTPQQQVALHIGVWYCCLYPANDFRILEDGLIHRVGRQPRDLIEDHRDDAEALLYARVIHDLAFLNVDPVDCENDLLGQGTRKDIARDAVRFVVGKGQRKHFRWVFDFVAPLYGVATDDPTAIAGGS